VLLKASSWLNGRGVTVYSNGSKEGTRTSCAPRAVDYIDGRPMPSGYEWKAMELVNRLYLTRGWMDTFWPGTGGDSSPGLRDSMYYSAPNGLRGQAEGSISYVAPGDAVFVNEYHKGAFLPGGDALIVNAAAKLTRGRVPLVSQNSGSPRAADPMSSIVPVLQGGRLTFSSPKGDPYTFATIGVVHAPRSGPVLAGVKSVVSGGETYCALLTGGGVDCWGVGGFGGLGNGTELDSAFPVAVTGFGGQGMLSDVTSIASDGGSTCAVLTDGGVDCWGDGLEGRLGNGDLSGAVSPYPVAVEGVGGPGALSGVASLVAGHIGYCALLTDGGVDCWGLNEFGELGNGTTTNSAFPERVEGVGGTGSLSGVTSISSSPDSYRFCALVTGGGVDCWGDGESGALGNGANASSAFPVAVEGAGGSGSLAGVASLTAGDAGSCALLTSGRVDCWGDGYAGALGNGAGSNSPFPVAVEGVGGVGSLTGVSSLAADDLGYCALLTSSGVDCWGWGYEGELGNGSLTAALVPVAVVGVGGSGALSGVASLTAPGGGYFGPRHFCALLVIGRVDCWGDGLLGELGNSRYSQSPYPVQVERGGGAGSLSGVASLADWGADGTCALLTGGTVDCWGRNTEGELGRGVFSIGGHPGSAVAAAVVEPGG
jgi:alpha-tubulin suppressor-like RCC1 family protein